MKNSHETALFAAGCFWGVQYYFDQVPGVLTSIVGYTGGHTKNPTYEDVCYKNTGHAEAVKITFDPEVISYKKLVEHFLYMHDPTQVGGQGIDVGDEYRSAIFYTDQEQLTTAKKVIKQAIANYNKPIVTELTAASTFYIAEDYHQKFAERTGRGICHRPYNAAL